MTMTMMTTAIIATTAIMIVLCATLPAINKQSRKLTVQSPYIAAC